MMQTTPGLKRGSSPALLILLLVLCCSITPAAAITVSFSDLNLVSEQQVTIYNTTTEKVLATTNTSATAIDIGPVEAISIAIQPARSNRWQDPKLIVDDFLDYFLTHLVQILWVILAIGLAYMWGGRKR